MNTISERSPTTAYEDTGRNGQDPLLEMLNCLPDAVLLLTEEGMVTSANDRAIDLFGWGSGELAGIKLPELALQTGTSEGGGQGAFETKMTHRDGSVFWVEAALRRSIFAGSVRIIASFRSIQERKDREDELRTREAQLSRIFDSSHNGMAFTDYETGRIVDVNQTWTTKSGIQRELALGKTALELGIWTRREDRDVCVARVKSQGRVVDFEASLMMRDSSQSPHLISAEMVELKNRRFVLWEFRDIGQIRKAEHALRLSEWSYREIFNAATEAIFIHEGSTGRVLDVNESMLRLYGFSREEIGTLNPTQCSLGTSPYSEVEVRQWMKKARDEGPQIFEWIARKKNGTLFWVEVSLKAAMINGVHCILAMARDVEARKRAEAGLQHLNRMMELILENIPAFVFWKDVNLRYLGCNKLFAKAAGVEHPAEIVGKTDHELSWRESADAYQADDRMVLKSGRSKLNFEETQVLPDGEIKLLNTSKTPLLDEHGRSVGILGVYIDVSERRKTELALREAHDRLATLFENGRDAAMIADSETGVILDANRAAMNLMQRTREELIGLHQSQLHPAEFADKYQESFLKAVQGELGFVVGDVARPDGSRVPVEITPSLIELANGRKVLMGVFRDISERRQLELQFLQSQKMEAVGQLAGGVAHDFNNILACIMLHLGMLRQEEDLPPFVRESIKDLETEARRAASLTRQLLMFSRRSVLERKILDLNSLIHNLLKMLRRLIGEQVTLEFKEGHALPMLEADHGMLEQVLLNLCVNARDAMPKGGSITILTENVVFQPRDLHVHPDARPGSFLCLSVQDTGFGMDDATLKRIFEPFFTTKEAGKGTGLGLATVYGIVVQHDGWLEVNSRPGVGTTFRIYLPASSAATEDQAELAEQHAVRGNETILLVEDDPGVRKQQAQGLRILGYRVLEASNGQEALDVWRAHSGSIHLLLSDMVMPGGMTGLDLAEAMRAGKPDLKIVISSGYSTDLTGLGNPAQQGICYLPKPYPMSTLWRVVRACLDGKTPANLASS